MVIKKNMFVFTFMLLTSLFIFSSFTFAAQADFEYCPDGTMVETLADCPDFKDDALVKPVDEGDEAVDTIASISKRSARTGRNPQIGKEIQITDDSDGDGMPDLKDFDTIDNAPEEKERASLSKADAKKALDGFSRSINTIQSSLERCETDVCRQVSANADKRYDLVMQAQRDIDTTYRYVQEVRSIVREDIISLERCDTEVCRDVLSQEKQLLLTITDYLDLDSDGDGMPDFRDEDSDGDGLSDVTEQAAQRDVDKASPKLADTLSVRDVDKASPKLFESLSARNLSAEDKEAIRKYLLAKSELQGADFGLAVAYAASGNEQVRSVRYINETDSVEVDHDEEVRLLGLIPIKVQAKTIIDSERNERTEYPWWAIFASSKKGYDYYQTQSNNAATEILENDENPLAVDEMGWVESATQ